MAVNSYGGAQGVVSTAGGSTIITSAPATKGLVVKAAAAQAANLQEWQGSDGTVLSRIGPLGGLVASGVTAAPVTNNTALAARGASNQTANLFEAQTSDGVARMSVDKDGTLIPGRGIYAVGPIAGTAGNAVAQLVTPANAAGLLVALASGAANAAIQVNDSDGNSRWRVDPTGEMHIRRHQAGGGGNLVSLTSLNSNNGTTRRKYLRINDAGGLEFINDASSAVIATLEDSGALTATDFRVGGVSIAGGERKIQEYIIPNGGANSFALIPSMVAYRTLRITVEPANDGRTTSADCTGYLYFNGQQNAGQYHWGFSSSAYGGAGSSSESLMQLGTINGGTSPYFMEFLISRDRGQMMGRKSYSSLVMQVGGGFNTGWITPVTSVSFSLSTGLWAAGVRFTVYGTPN